MLQHESRSSSIKKFVRTFSAAKCYQCMASPDLSRQEFLTGEQQGLDAWCPSGQKFGLYKNLSFSPGESRFVYTDEKRYKKVVMPQDKSWTINLLFMAFVLHWHRQAKVRAVFAQEMEKLSKENIRTKSPLIFFSHFSFWKPDLG